MSFRLLKYVSHQLPEARDADGREAEGEGFVNAQAVLVEAPNKQLLLSVVFLLTSSKGKGTIRIESYPCPDVFHEDTDACI